MASSKKPTVSKKPTTKKVAKKQTTKVVEKEIPLKIFTCKNCKNKFFDTSFYFYNKASTKCLWCTKFPSRKV